MFEIIVSIIFLEQVDLSTFIVNFPKGNQHFLTILLSSLNAWFNEERKTEEKREKGKERVLLISIYIYTVYVVRYYTKVPNTSRCRGHILSWNVKHVQERLDSCRR